MIGKLIGATNKRDLVKASLEIIEVCRATQGVRAAYCRQLAAMIETGRQDGSRAIINKLFSHVDRTAAYLWNPTSLEFGVDYENDYDMKQIERAGKAAKLVTHHWQRTNLDMRFGQGVVEALKYGCCILKQWVQTEGRQGRPAYHHRLLMPWQFGVYNEYLNDLSDQPAFCETQMLTLPEVWRRICMLPDAATLFNRIKQSSMRGQADGQYNSFFHTVLSTSTLNTGNVGMTRPTPGGIVGLSSDPNYAVIGPTVAADMVKWHELWAWDGSDYLTVQICEPDILIAPRDKRRNLLVDPPDGSSMESGLHPYTKIAPGNMPGYFWDRSEIVDLIEPQGLLAVWADDTKRMMGLQFDKILGFSGNDGITEEVYDAQRNAGYVNAGPGGSIVDLTPKFPEQAVPMLELLMRVIDNLGGFDNILGGGGEPGVRAGTHAETLVKTSAPRLRDRSLTVERQAAEAADLTLSLKEIKDGNRYWTNPKDPEGSSFLLSDIPDDRRVNVVGHSSSPIFQESDQQLVAFGIKDGIVDQESAIDLLPFRQKDLLKQRLHAKMEKQEQMVQQLIKLDPEHAAKALLHTPGHK